MIDKFVNENILEEIAREYGTPFYLYDESTILTNIDKLQKISKLPNYKINYAVKANSNVEILKIMNKKGLKVDATGYGELYINQHAGFSNKSIYVVGNNFTKKEMKKLAKENVLISFDSLEQIKMFGEICPNYEKVMIRLNPNFGAGANKNVVTGGKKTKFAIDYSDFDEANEIAKACNLKIIGINQHIGSAYLEHESLIKGVKTLLDFIIEKEINDLEVIDFGGGFGLDYERNHRTKEMDFEVLTNDLNEVFEIFLTKYQNKEVSLEFEPGRYIVASAGILVGEITSTKERGGINYIGTNLGFNNLIRPVLYGAYHEVEILTDSTEMTLTNVVGNLCESGDFMCENRKLPKGQIEDLVVVYDTGAYGYCLASNYNSRLRPIELMITKNKEVKVIRKRETLEDLIKY